MPLVEKRYANALFELSQNSVNSVIEEFKDFLEIYKSENDFSSFLCDPRIKLEDKQAVIRNIFTDRLSETMLNFVLLLIAKRRIKYINQIYKQFVHVVNEWLNTLEIKIISAKKLEDDQLQRIKQKFGIKYKAAAVKSTEIVDPSIIGGLKVVVGDKVYDGSIKGRIESLTELVRCK